jgi:nucleotide-binding universal stress UspA family protein
VSEEKTMYTRMLIPLDGPATAEKVLPYARSLAGTLKIPVELLGVIDMSAIATHIPAERAKTFIDHWESGTKAYLEEIARSFPGLSVKCTVGSGRPEEVIIAKAAEDKSTLITMATHGRSGVSRWLLGSVAEKVLRATSNPLLLIRAADEAGAEGEATLKSIVVPLDGSELAESVLATVAEVAKLLNLEIVLIRAYELPAAAYYGSEDYLPNYDEIKGHVEGEARSYLDKKIEALQAKGLEKVSSVLMEGPAADEIIEIARKTPDNLVAMCTHGRSGVRRWVLGSVTEKVVRHSGDPVLVVRAA